MPPRRRATDERTLLRLTGLPTAAGREDRVVAWVRRWAKRRRDVSLRTDRYGNLLIARRGQRQTNAPPPILFTAHLDHPAFVVTEVSGRELTAEFRGGVHDDYFVGTAVRLQRSIDPPRGVVQYLDPASPPDRPFKRVRVRFAKPVRAEPGDVLTWDLPAPRIARNRLRAPACDDLAAVAAMFCAFDVLRRSRSFRGDVRLLCTRAEEIGFIGAMGACRSGLIPAGARLIALENSKAFAESPLGGGPIVRVGDRTSVFDPALTDAAARAAAALQTSDPTFRWQRRLMPGGTCEATAYQALGHTATCLCLPLANYHNMDEAHHRIAPESIHIDDYHGLIRLLVHLARHLDAPDRGDPLPARLDRLFRQHEPLLQTPS
ncbi:MAG: M20/M25/M40 family metallo-hydrolase [Planctomycetota bacterium]